MLNSEKMLASLEQQDLKRAEKYFERALKQDPDEVLMELGAYLEGIGFLPHAKKLYQQLVEHYPEFHLNLALIANEDGETETAFGHLDAVPKDNPELQVNALVIMADLYQQEGLADVAKEKLLQALAIHEDPVVRFGLAEIEFELEDYQAAINDYASLDQRQFLEEFGISTYQRIGISYANMGKFEAAIEFLEKSVEIEYDDATVLSLATLLADQEDYQKANHYFKQLETLSPDYEGYEYAYASSLHGEHKTEEALRVVQSGLSKNSFDTNLLLLASQLSYELHDEKAAESYLLQAKKDAVDTEEINLRLANLYNEQERYDETVALAAEEPDSVLTKWHIARAYHELDDDKTLEAYQALLNDLKDNPEFLQEYIYVAREFGATDQVQEQIKAYLQLVPDDVSMAELLNEEW